MISDFHSSGINCYRRKSADIGARLLSRCCRFFSKSRSGLLTYKKLVRFGGSPDGVMIDQSRAAIRNLVLDRRTSDID